MQEIQTGLYLISRERTINNKHYTFYELSSIDGYCFYDKRTEYYDEDGNLIPEDEILPTQRTYMRYASLGLSDSPDNYVSVKIEEGFEIV